MRKHIIYRYFLFLSLVGLMQLTLSCSSSSNEIEPLKPEGEDTPLEKDEYTFMNVEYRKWQNGTFQAWITADSRETRTIDNMNWYTPSSDYSRTAWGGRIGLQPSSVVGKEGFFRVANCRGRSYLLDPDNGAVIIHGIQHVRPGESTAHKKAFGTRYGSEAQWSEETGKLLADNHINYISYGSNRIEVFPAAVRGNLLTPKTQKIAYAENLYLLRTFMWDMSKNLGYAFDDDKYNRLVLLFEPTFATYIDRLVQEKSALFAGDRHFIGFYLDNELPFASYQGTGYANTEGGGWLVHTQKNRGEFYQNFCLRLLETHNCVGWVHFEYNDGYDSNGKASNKGVVSIEYEPYESFLSQMRQLNLSVHSLIDYYDTKSVQ